MSIKLEIVDYTSDHIIVRTTEPARFEISLLHDGFGHGRILVHGYKGAETDMEQEPNIVYDGTEAAFMEDMEDMEA